MPCRPPGLAEVQPMLGVPSPQSIVAVKSLTVPSGLASVKVPTTEAAERDARVSAHDRWPPAVSAASAIVAVDAPVDGDRGRRCRIGDRHQDLVRALFGQREGRGGHGVLGRVADLGDAGAGTRASKPPIVGDRDRSPSIADRVGAAGVDERGDRAGRDGHPLGADDREDRHGERPWRHRRRGRGAGCRAGPGGRSPSPVCR